MPTSKDELGHLIELLSDEECASLLKTVRDVVEGEPIWEDDCGLFYNEYVKLRRSMIPQQGAVSPGNEQDVLQPIPLTKSCGAGERVMLPALPSLGVTVAEALGRRRSRRDYDGQAINITQLSALLGYACGVTGVVEAYGYDRFPLRSFPSHGGLQSPEVYVAILAVDGCKGGIYHYHALDHSLERMETYEHKTQICELVPHESYIREASVVLILTGSYERLRWKYGERAYRFICIDVGFAGENLYLCAEALGLGACAISGFAQDKAEELLGIDGKGEIALMLMTFGPPRALAESE
jgi:SagB-type dehydrogenase family enzyme